LRRKKLLVNVKMNVKMNQQMNKNVNGTISDTTPKTAPPKVRDTGSEEALLSCFPPRCREESPTVLFARWMAAGEAEQVYHGLRLLEPIDAGQFRSGP
jgi:hypothetical protein